MPDVIGSLLGGVGLGGNAIGAAVVRLRLDSDDYKKQLSATHAQTTNSADAMGKSWGNFGAVAKASALAAGAAVVGLAAASIKAAADQNEALNVVNKTFGATADTITRFAETSATSFGISETAALQAAGGFGAMLKSAGITGDALADMSTKVVGLAGDLASFKNVAPEEALEKLRSGLAGEAEPLRTFGVFLSDATVKAEAYKSGIAKVGEELTEAQKVQARYELILKQTTDAHGDFAKTLGESLPNQLRAARAEATNLAADLGQHLIPAVLGVTKAGREIVDAVGPLLQVVFADIGQSAEELAGWIGAVGQELRVLLELIPGTGSAAENTAGLFDKLRGAAADLALSAAPAGSLLREAGEAMHLASEAAEANTTTLGELQNATEGFGSAAFEVANMLKTGFISAISKVKDTQKEVATFANKTGEELKEFRDSAHESFEGFVFDMEAATKDTRIGQREFRLAFDAMEEDARRLRDAMRLLKHDDWVNDRFLEFLTNLGPEWLIRFSKMNEEHQRKWQDDWRQTNDRVHTTNESFGTMIGLLDKMDKGTSKHEVIIEYKYVGFDPTKPGMAGVQKSQ